MVVLRFCSLVGFARDRLLGGEKEERRTRMPPVFGTITSADEALYPKTLDLMGEAGVAGVVDRSVRVDIERQS